MKNKSVNKTKQHEQLSFDAKKLEIKRFTLSNMITAKLNTLADKIDQLSHSEVVWLSRIEDFFSQYEYVTERHTQIIDTIIRNNLDNRRPIP